VSFWYLPQGKYSFRGNIDLEGEKLIVWIEAPTQTVEKPAASKQRARTRNAHASIALPEEAFISQKNPISPEDHTPKRQSN
jgi:hypothetical protein